MTSSTVVAILTGTGQSGIAVAALAGPGARALAAQVFTPARPTDVANAPAGALLYGHVRDGDETVDEALLAVRRPAADWIAEINCHGGTLPVRRTADALERLGARRVSWEEFLRLTGPDRISAEAEALLARAATRRGARVLGAAAGGAVTNEIRRIAHMAESGRIDDALAAVGRLLATAPLGRRLTRPACVVIAGAPNVGKSSLLNALVGSARALVHPTAGTTRDIVRAEWSVRGLPVTFADTAGLRDAGDEVEIEGVRLARRAAGEADLVCAVADLSRPAAESTPADLVAPGVPLVWAANKADLPRAFDPRELRRVADAPVVVTSAVAGEGIEQLAEAIEGALLRSALDTPDNAPVVFSEKLEIALRGAAEALRADPPDSTPLRALLD